ncbi:AraC family transcriptional regulator [Caldibacillus lycopersici]|uniref:AraC family transcriptional regulator n=1 Tax=Perspicuibacillus lycopersici TaxID=1325689 RepID=A0AAE3LPE1_9BACI|nr:AraC family transcriptional regulator [Perspicuibacillus lycopersici]MCU9614891.1 AraC family transcriptional regulator [Perspicuibacillus lycopersici]
MTNEKQNIIIQSIEYMKSHLNEDITSEQLAYYIGYSPYHFSRVFKEVTGVSPRHYLSALRIESGKQVLVNSSDSIVKAMLKAGFRSSGTFSSKFKQFVGVSPKQFQQTMESLHQFVNDFDSHTILDPLEAFAPSITCKVIAPPTFKGTIFVGLFPRPIPDQVPIVGTALPHHQTSCTFSNVPTGKYYLLAAAISRSLNPKHYFDLSNALRGMADDPIHTEHNSATFTEVTLREPLPFDPPILINLPKLLFDTKNRKLEEK